MEEVRLTQSEKNVLTEVRRRIKEFKEPRGLDKTKMIFLGYPSETKTLIEKDILSPYSKEVRRALNWYNLTEKGSVLILSNHERNY